MPTCPVCGTELSVERPRYNVLLEFKGQTRSAAQSQYSSTSAECKGELQRQLCTDCWEDLHADLTGE